MLLSDFAGCRTGILGLGREGLAAWRALRRRHPEQVLWLFAEAAPDPETAALLNPELDFLRISSFTEMADTLKGLDVLIRSPGISPYREELQAARAAGVRITSGSSIWFAENPDARTIAITGTKGKSTTASLTAHLLRTQGLRAEAVGNIGRALLDCPAETADWWVVELSSYQLCDLEARPTLGAVLNLSDEHLTWHGSAARYRADKLRLVDLLDGRPLVADRGCMELTALLAGRAGVHWFNHAEGWCATAAGLNKGDRHFDGGAFPQLPGQHNRANLAAALSLVELAGVPIADPVTALAGWESLPHRLRQLGAHDGLTWVDDSLSTTPVATLAALAAFRGLPVTLLAGGHDRGLDWTRHVAQFRQLAPFAVIGLPDSGLRVLTELQAGGLTPAGGLHQVTDLAAGITLARQLTPRGGLVLLSPGAPSFPQFRDYRERGLAFARLAGFGV